MALQLDNVTDFGVTCNYWRILTINFSQEDGATDIFIALYLSKAARNAGSVPIRGLKLVVKNGAFKAAVGAGPFVPACYDFIKTLPEFAGALDV